MSTEVHDLRSLTERLGTPHELASAAESEFRRARFCGRHPVLAFVVLPLVALPLLWAAMGVTVVLAAKLLGFAGEQAAGAPLAAWATDAGAIIARVMVLLPVLFAAALFCRMALRSAVAWHWTIVACALVAVFGGLAMAQIGLPGDGHQGTLSFGFGVSRHPSWAQIVQFALPLAIGGWTVWRQLVRERRTATE